MKRLSAGLAILTAVILPVSFSGQERITQVRFDSLHGKAMGSLTNDIHTAEQCAEIIATYEPELSPSQKARLGYLKMRLINAGESASIIVSKKVIPDTIFSNNPDTLGYYSRRYLECSLPDKAIPLLMKAVELQTKGSDYSDHLKIELCEAYRQKQEYNKATGMIYDLLSRLQPLSDNNRAYAWNRLAALYNEWGHPPLSFTDSVFKYSLLCMELSEKTGDISDLAASQNELGYQYILRKEYSKALDLLKHSVTNFLATGKPFHAMNALINQSSTYIQRRDYHEALSVLEQTTMIAPIWENPNLYLRIYNQYVSIYSGIGDYREAYEFQTLVNAMQRDFFKDRMNLQIIELSARYDLLVKEQKIKEEQKKNEFNRRQIFFLIIISIILTMAFLSSLFYFRLWKKGSMKQKLTEAVVETETNERRRIARDLHDGLGPVLSAINHYFQAYLDARPSDKETIQTRLQMVISEAIEEVSRISHNISPHVLEKYGLITALNSLLTPFRTNGKYQVDFTNSINVKLNPKIELTVYRCITELVNNTIKHAGADRIILYTGLHEGKLWVRYSDNGKGFSAGSGKQEGMGLLNIENRVKSSGGRISLRSSPDFGTIVEISIPI